MHVNIYIYIYIYIYILVYTKQTDILWALICCITQLNYWLSQSDVLASKNKLPLLLDYLHENPIFEERRSDLTLILFSKWCLLNKRKQLIRLTYPQLLTGSLMNWFRTFTHVTAEDLCSRYLQSIFVFSLKHFFPYSLILRHIFQWILF